MSATPLPGYSTQGPLGKRTNIVEITGPASYATGGQTITAAQFGAGGFDAVLGVGLSYSGTYFVRAQYLAVDAAPSALKGAVASVKLVWYNHSDGLEVTALTALNTEIVRVFMILV